MKTETLFGREGLELIDSEFDDDGVVCDLFRVMLEKNKTRLKDKYETRVKNCVQAILTLSKEVEDEEPF